MQYAVHSRLAATCHSSEETVTHTLPCIAILCLIRLEMLSLFSDHLTCCIPCLIKDHIKCSCSIQCPTWPNHAAERVGLLSFHHHHPPPRQAGRQSPPGQSSVAAAACLSQPPFHCVQLPPAHIIPHNGTATAVNILLQTSLQPTIGLLLQTALLHSSLQIFKSWLHCNPWRFISLKIEVRHF